MKAPGEGGHAEAELDRLIVIRFRPVWAYIDAVREFGRVFCETTFPARKIAERVRVVIQEALENAVKYSVQGDRSELEVLIRSDGQQIEISVESTPDAEHLDTLKAELETLYSKPPQEAYLAAFERAATSKRRAARLGLARIRFEGGVDIAMHEEPGGRIRLTASGAL